MVHGIRTSATMWRAQSVHLQERGVPAITVDLPGHGRRMDEAFTLGGALETIDAAVTQAAAGGDVLLVGHSMGGLLATAYAGREDKPPISGLIAASATAIPSGVALGTYRLLARGFDRLPHRGADISEWVLDHTLPEQTRADFGAGGYALDSQDVALGSLADLDLPAALSRIDVPTWFINGQYDQLRIAERQFVAQVPGSELIIVPRTAHLITAMRPRVFNALLDLALATMDAERASRP